MRLIIVMCLLFVTCASTRVMYVDGAREKKKFEKELEEKGGRVISEKPCMNGVWEIEYKE